MDIERINSYTTKLIIGDQNIFLTDMVKKDRKARAVKRTIDIASVLVLFIAMMFMVYIALFKTDTGGYVQVDNDNGYHYQYVEDIYLLTKD